jgi:hypothetical protein
MCPAGNLDHIPPLPAQLDKISGDEKSRWNGKSVQNLQAISKENSKAVIKGQENPVRWAGLVLGGRRKKVGHSGKDEMVLEEPELFDEGGAVFGQDKMVNQDPVSPSLGMRAYKIPHPNGHLFGRVPCILAEARPGRRGPGEHLPVYRFIFMIRFSHSPSPTGF